MEKYAQFHNSNSRNANGCYSTSEKACRDCGIDWAPVFKTVIFVLAVGIFLVVTGVI